MAYFKSAAIIVACRRSSNSDEERHDAINVHVTGGQAITIHLLIFQIQYKSSLVNRKAAALPLGDGSWCMTVLHCVRYYYRGSSQSPPIVTEPSVAACSSTIHLLISVIPNTACNYTNIVTTTTTTNGWEAQKDLYYFNGRWKEEEVRVEFSLHIACVSKVEIVLKDNYILCIRSARKVDVSDATAVVRLGLIKPAV
jgi:hypothetical protein